MKSKRSRQRRSPTSTTTYIDEVMEQLFKQAKSQFGDAIKAFWFYEGELCPACLKNTIGMMNFKGENALAINAFIYRERGLLIGYFLCETCAVYIFDEARKNPYKQTPLHTDIENNLKDAYHKHLMTLNA